MRKFHRSVAAALTRPVIVSAVLALTMAIGPQARSDEAPVRTIAWCSDPEIPALILTVAFPRDAAIFEQALRTGVCEHTDEAAPVTPIFFLRRVKTTPTSVEPYGYIWAIRLGGPKVSYWFFWQDAHETMLNKTPGI